MEHFFKKIIQAPAGGAGLRIWDVLEALVRLLLGGTFLYAAALKIADPGLFLFQIRSYKILPDPLAAWVAMGLPWLELFIGISLILGLLYRGGVALLLTILLVFLAAILSAYMRGLEISCGCFGASEEAAAYAVLIIRDLIMLVAAGFLALRMKAS